MKSSKKRIFILSILLVIVVLCYLLINYSSYIDFDSIFNFDLLYKLIVLILFLILLVIINFIKSRSRLRENKYRDKLFNSLVKNSDTIYIMIDKTNNKVLYLSDNVNQVLGIKNSFDEKKKNQIVQEILSIPILKSELKSWNGKDNYVSGMLSYDNPIYQHESWIKIKIYPYKEKKNIYHIIQISDVSKEHSRQHMLITQTVDIKSREKQLNQITSSSYDMEINVNVITHTYELKYFKQDMKYFGLEKSGNFNTDFNELVKKYVNVNDQEDVLKVLSINNFQTLASLKKLEPITIRYRLGNEIKNNTWLESTAFFITNKDKILVSILTKNVTENAESIREQNILLQNTLNEVKTANESKTNLIKTISHDIRTPMTTIKGLSDDLLNSKLDNNILEDIKNINDSSIEVIDIIDGLLGVSKNGKNYLKKEEKEYNIFSLFKDIANKTEELIGNKQIKLNINLDSNLPVILYGDNKKIKEIMNKVVSNSVKFTDEGQISINVTGNKNGNNVDLKVIIEDSGCGIEEDKLNNIFNDNSNTGLDSVKKLIKLLDGKIEIESRINEYTLVTIYLTQKIVEDNKIREMMQKNEKTKIYDFNNKKILIVDDNKLNLKVTSRMLELYNLNITTVESGQECIDNVKNSKYDLIFLDQMMPGMDGATTLKKLKEIKDFNIPVIALTADAIEGQKEKYISMGFNDYISKPIDKGELSRVLKKYLK